MILSTLLRDVLDRVVTMQASDRSLEPGATLESLRQADGRPGYAMGLRHGVVGQGSTTTTRSSPCSPAPGMTAGSASRTG